MFHFDLVVNESRDEQTGRADQPDRRKTETKGEQEVPREELEHFQIDKVDFGIGVWTHHAENRGCSSDSKYITASSLDE